MMYIFGNQSTLYIVQQYILQFIINIMNELQSYQGINWGQLELTQEGLKLKNSLDNHKTIIGFDYKNVRNAGLNKNDLFLEIEERNSQLMEDRLCEVRFTSYANPVQDGNDEEMKIDKNSPEQVLKQILKHYSQGNLCHKSIVTVDDLHFISPRGNYSVDFYEQSIRFHGSSYSFVIQNKHFLKGFFLPMDNQTQTCIGLQLHKQKSIYHGSTPYQFLIMQMKKSEQIELNLNIEKDDALAKEKKLQYEYKGFLNQILIQFFRKIVNLNIIAPDPKDFCSKNKQSCVRAAVKAQNGWLFFFKKSLVYIFKPALCFKLENIKKVEFMRVDIGSRHFDVKISLKNQQKSIEFLNIEKIELDNISEYFASRNVAIDQEKPANNNFIQEGQSDEEDDDFKAVQAEESEEDSNSDQSLGEEQSEQSIDEKIPKKKKKQT